MLSKITVIATFLLCCNSVFAFGKPDLSLKQIYKADPRHYTSKVSSISIKPCKTILKGFGVRLGCNGRVPNPAHKSLNLVISSVGDSNKKIKVSLKPWSSDEWTLDLGVAPRIHPYVQRREHTTWFNLAMFQGVSAHSNTGAEYWAEKQSPEIYKAVRVVIDKTGLPIVVTLYQQNMKTGKDSAALFVKNLKKSHNIAVPKMGNYTFEAKDGKKCKISVSNNYYFESMYAFFVMTKVDRYGYDLKSTGLQKDGNGNVIVPEGVTGKLHSCFSCQRSSGVLPGLQGINPKKNRTVRLTVDEKGIPLFVSILEQALGPDTYKVYYPR